MTTFNVEVAGGSSVRLTTAGKYCDRDIIVTATGGGGGNESIDGIPADYERCDYIQFNDAQVVDTGIVCNQDTKLRIIFTRESTASQYMYGVASDGNLASVTAYLGDTWRFGNKSASKGNYVAANNDIVYTVIVDKTQIHVPNSKSALSDVDEFETEGTLLLGTCRTNGAIQSAQFIGKIFHLEIWQGEEKVLNLVPVVSKDGIYRFWDKVSETFLDSQTEVMLGGGNI